ncbi:MAG: response regulator [Methylotenera sp.]|nr:response regulator [Oligoflexia bacterium]
MVDLKILVVDDMPAMRSIVSGMLEELGCRRVLQAEDAEIAWRLVQSAHSPALNDGRMDPFHLILSDWNMPGMSGVDLLRSLRGFAPTRKLPFLMMTAKNDQDHISEALRAGVSAYIVKPFSADQLGERISGIFSSAQS